MVAADPATLSDVGFLLSATATGGLLFLGDPLSERLAFLPSAIREGLATSLAATLPTLPIIAAVFGRVSLVSPLANLAAVPLFAPLMLSGAASAAIGALSIDLARVPALGTYALALLLRTIVESTASLPMASLAVPEGPLAGVLYGALVAAGLRFGPELAARPVGVRSASGDRPRRRRGDAALAISERRSRAGSRCWPGRRFPRRGER